MEDSLVAHCVVAVLILHCCLAWKHLSNIGLPVGNVKEKHNRSRAWGFVLVLACFTIRWIFVCFKANIYM